MQVQRNESLHKRIEMNEDGFRKKFMIRTSKSGGSEKFSHLRITFTLIDGSNSIEWLTDMFL